GHLHGLFLKDNDTQCPVEYGPQFDRNRMGPVRIFPAFKIGVNNPSLDGSGAHNGNLDDQVIIGGWLQAGEHAHLRPGLYLEYPDRIGLADHVEGGGIVNRDVLQPESMPLLTWHQLQAATQHAEHAQPEHINLEHAH